MINMMKYFQMMFGVATYIPKFNQIRRKKSGGTDSARYCYSVWLRHLVLARQNGLKSTPQVIAEMGPGDSLGIGLAALLSGVERYYAFDIVEYAATTRNLQILEELIELFRQRTPIPDQTEFPRLKPVLDDYSFPADLIDEELLQKSLSEEYIKKIMQSVKYPEAADSLIKYQVPWFDATIIASGTVDYIYSQAVLEHVDELASSYGAMATWLKPGGHMSHQIDFKSHGIADTWYGHWCYSNTTWKIIRGNRPYLLNREPMSTHLRLLKENGMEVKYHGRHVEKTPAPKAQLAPQYHNLDSVNLETSGVFLIAEKSTHSL